jgi:hypothetical protein
MAEPTKIFPRRVFEDIDVSKLYNPRVSRPFYYLAVTRRQSGMRRSETLPNHTIFKEENLGHGVKRITLQFESDEIARGYNESLKKLAPEISFSLLYAGGNSCEFYLSERDTFSNILI